MKGHIAAALVLVAFVSPLRAAEIVETTGTIDAVTVYRGQAMVTRVVDIPGPAGLHEVIVQELPEHVVAGSIYAESADGVQVRSVRYRIRPVAKDVRKEVRSLDEQLRQLQDRLEANQRNTQRINEHKSYLAKLEQFVAPTASAELTQGVLNADTLKELSDFLFQQRQMLSDEDLKLHRDSRDLQQQVETLTRERELLTGGSARTLREAVVFVNLSGPDGGRLRLRYLVNQANWTPSYNVRTTGDRRQVLVEYQASIQQLTGESWNDVAMTLSTATPSLTAKAPRLDPLAVALGPAVPLAQAPGQGQGQGQAAQPIQDLRIGAERFEQGKELLLRQLRDAERLRAQQRAVKEVAESDINQAAEQADEYQFDRQLNQVAGSLQMLDLLAKGHVDRSKQPAKSAGSSEGFSITYRLADRSSLPSRADQQLVQIAAIPLEGEFYKAAMPVLTNYVYEEARVTNTSDRVLLAGPVATYVDGQFVGHGQVPTVAVGESFTLGFGIDASLRGSRELVEKTESIQGGNRVITLTYRLALENFAATPATVRLLDRLPLAKEHDVKVTLLAPGADLSEDPEYRQTQHNKGILRWEVEVPNQAVGTSALALEYKFQLEYDKQMSVTGLPLAAR